MPPNVRVASPFAMYFLKKAVLWVRSESTALVPASAAWKEASCDWSRRLLLSSFWTRSGSVAAKIDRTAISATASTIAKPVSSSRILCLRLNCSP